MIGSLVSCAPLRGLRLANSTVSTGSRLGPASWVYRGDALQNRPETWFTAWRRTVSFPGLGLAHEDAFMPWKETRTVDQRLQFLSSYQKDEMSVTDLCHEYGISRPTAYKWIKRYDEVWTCPHFWHNWLRLDSQGMERMSHGSVTQDVHEGVQAGGRSAAGGRCFAGRSIAWPGGEPQPVGSLAA